MWFRILTPGIACHVAQHPQHWRYLQSQVSEGVSISVSLSVGLSVSVSVSGAFLTPMPPAKMTRTRWAAHLGPWGQPKGPLALTNGSSPSASLLIRPCTHHSPVSTVLPVFPLSGDAVLKYVEGGCAIATRI